MVGGVVAVLLAQANRIVCATNPHRGRAGAQLVGIGIATLANGTGERANAALEQLQQDVVLGGRVFFKLVLLHHQRGLWPHHGFTTIGKFEPHRAVAGGVDGITRLQRRASGQDGLAATRT